MYGQSSGGTYFDSQAGGAHVTTVVSSASGGVPPHGMVGIAMDVGSSHIISSGSTYLIHGGSMEGSRNHISHSSRSSSAMVSNTNFFCGIFWYPVELMIQQNKQTLHQPNFSFYSLKNINTLLLLTLSTTWLTEKRSPLPYGVVNCHRCHLSLCPGWPGSRTSLKGRERHTGFTAT